ncbi:MAG: DUF484 family protein [Pseudomonadota bacterium]
MRDNRRDLCDSAIVAAADDNARDLKALIRAMQEEARNNEQLLVRSQERELAILTADSLFSLFSTLTEGLRDSFDVDRVTLVLCDPDHEIRHLLIADGGPEAVPDGVRFFDSLSGIAPQYAALHKPWLGPFQTVDHQLIAGKGKYASLAILGLRRQGKLIGSLNLLSSDAHRYKRELGSDFLAHLAVIASFALENTVNRARLLRSGFTDVLTGWFNRRYLQVRLNEEIARARRHRLPLCCLFLDIDHFKRVNDQHGHHAGDMVLAECAHRIDAEVRSSDVAARYGGEEFVILLPESGLADAMALAERTREAVASKPFVLSDATTLSITVSVGVAQSLPYTASGDLKTLGEQLLKRADLAMYAAKSAGRNQVCAAPEVDQSTQA